MKHLGVLGRPGGVRVVLGVECGVELRLELSEVDAPILGRGWGIAIAGRRVTPLRHRLGASLQAMMARWMGLLNYRKTPSPDSKPSLKTLNKFPTNSLKPKADKPRGGRWASEASDGHNCGWRRLTRSDGTL